MALGFRDPDIPGDDRFHYGIAEETAGIGGDKFREIVPAVVHGQYDAGGLQSRIELPADMIDRAGQMTETLQREKLALQGRNDTIGGNQRIQGKQPETGRAVDQNVVVVIDKWLQRRLKALFPVINTDQFDFRTDQFRTGRNDLKIVDTAVLDERGSITFTHQQGVGAELSRIVIHTQPGRGISLRVQIDKHDARAILSEGGGEIDGGRGFANPAFLVGDGQDDCGIWFSFMRRFRHA